MDASVLNDSQKVNEFTNYIAVFQSKTIFNHLSQVENYSNNADLMAKWE